MKVKSISLKAILMSVVILLGVVPLILMNTVVHKTVRENTIENTINLTHGLLNQSQKYLNEILNELDNFSNNLSTDNELIKLLDQDQTSLQFIHKLEELLGSTEIIENVIIIDLNTEHNTLFYRNSTNEVTVLSTAIVKKFLQSQQALLLKENSKRSLWLGSGPKGVLDIEKSMWNYRILKTKHSNFIYAVSLKKELLSDLISTIENSTNSEALLITSDNTIFPRYDNYFNYSFAPKTLSKTTKGRFINFTDSRIKNSKKERLLIQLFSDPKYFYNLIILTPEEELLEAFFAISRTTNLTLLLLSIFSISFGFIGVNLIQKRISQLTTGLRSIYLGIFKMTKPKRKIVIKEDLKLTHAIIDVASEVNNARDKLKEINESLEERVLRRTEELEMTRESLEHSEKMAMLGRNAAKIAHEINTPLGISITATSHLSINIEDLIDKFDHNTLKKSYLSNFSQSSKEVLEMIIKNLKRASALTASFKSFASDISVEDQREINIKTYIEEIVKSYSFKLNKTNFNIVYSCSDDISVEINPAIIYQIITNLINNSLLHGFDKRESGIINVTVLHDRTNLEIIIEDDGVGISEKNQLELYKPFFTTKHGEGGTGLGLNIIKELIEKRLNGTISCISSIGQGTKFIIIIPKGDKNV